MNKRILTMIATAGVVSLLMTSCQKEIAGREDGTDVEMLANEPEERDWSAKFSASYYFVPDFDNGWVAPNPAPGWFPGQGTGNATHVGKAISFFNQYATLGPNGLTTVGAPVNLEFEEELADLGYTDIPDEVDSFVGDSKGNSIWFQSTTGNATVPVSATRIEFSGNLAVIGGTGKFEGATGLVRLTGYFNPQDQNDAGFTTKGTIIY